MVDQAGNAAVRICGPVVTTGVLTLDDRRRAAPRRDRRPGRPRRSIDQAVSVTKPPDAFRPTAAIAVTTGVLTLDDDQAHGPR